MLCQMQPLHKPYRLVFVLRPLTAAFYLVPTIRFHPRWLYADRGLPMRKSDSTLFFSLPLESIGRENLPSLHVSRLILPFAQALSMHLLVSRA
jgi:hypothetical protein